MKKIKRIFICENGHKYESNEPVQSFIQQGISYAISKDESIKCNGFCKICDSLIIMEQDFVKGKLVMGALCVV